MIFKLIVEFDSFTSIFQDLTLSDLRDILTSELAPALDDVTLRSIIISRVR